MNKMIKEFANDKEDKTRTNNMSKSFEDDFDEKYICPIHYVPLFVLPYLFSAIFKMHTC